MSKTISLTQGKFAIVDDEDYDELIKYKWYTQEMHGNWYACRNVTISYKPRKQQIVFMHWVILNGKWIDHVNRDGLDNRKSNLRFCTCSQNNKNSKLRRNNTSGLRGVSWHNCTQKWSAYIIENGRQIHLGLFNDKIEAGQIVDKKAKQLYGEFAVMNFP